MSVKMLTPLDLTGLEIQNALAHVLASDPGSPVAGQFWYRSDLGTLSFRNAASAIRLGRLDQITAPTASVSLNGQLITNLGTPSSTTDAATKAYVDGVVGGGISWKNPVRVATTAAGTLATSFANGQTVDGTVLATGDRILLKDQAAPAENGLYTVNAAGAPTRATDADIGTELVAATVFVTTGTVNADLAYTQTTDGPITLGTTGLTWVQISGLGQITAGAGLTKTGNVIDVIGTAARITVAADSVDIAATYVGQASITTLGTITTGTWTGTTIAAPNGGTGIASPTAASVLVTQGASAMTVASGSAANTVLRRGAAGDPAFGAVDISTAQVTGTLAVANGGTGGNSTANAKTALGFMGRFAQDVGDGSTTSIVVTHGLGTKDVHAHIFDNTTPFAEAMVETRHTSTTTLTLVFAVAPTTNQYHVVVVG